jgi:TPR repeat protein
MKYLKLAIILISAYLLPGADAVFSTAVYAQSQYTNAPAQKSDSGQNLIQKANNGDIAAQKKLADMYEKGSGGVQKDWETSFKWRLSAAKAGDRDSMFKAARVYEKSAQTEAYRKAAITWYQKIAKAGFSQQDTRDALNKIKILNGEKSTAPAKKDDSREIVGIVSKKRVKGRDDDDPQKRAQALFRQAEALWVMRNGNLVIPDGHADEMISLYEQAAALGHQRAAEKARALRAYLYD